MGHDSAVLAFIAVNIVIFIYTTYHKHSFSKSLKTETNRVLAQLRFSGFDERGTLKVLEQVKDSFKVSPLLDAYWNNFSATLVATDSIKKEPIYSSQDSSEIFNIENIFIIYLYL